MLNQKKGEGQSRDKITDAPLPCGSERCDPCPEPREREPREVHSRRAQPCGRKEKRSSVGLQDVLRPSDQDDELKERDYCDSETPNPHGQRKGSVQVVKDAGVASDVEEPSEHDPADERTPLRLVPAGPLQSDTDHLECLP